MKKNIYFFLITSFFVVARTQAITHKKQHTIEINQSQAQSIGNRIWHNECKGSIPGLTSWNDGEDFASLGIGHFIWYPEGKRGPFIERFPDFVAFCREHKKKLPAWLEAEPKQSCPWKNKVEFLKDFDTQKMKELRDFLYATIDLQITFIVLRLQQLLVTVSNQNHIQQVHILNQFNRLAQSAQGLYALIDYVNFKGEGTLAAEAYKGQGWGLLHVLKKMNGTKADNSALQEFAAAAKEVLATRVANSPVERNEIRWLPGWNNRIDTYLK